MSWQYVKNAAVLAMVGAVGLPLTGCTSGDTGATGNVVVTDPIVYTKRGLAAIGDPLDPVTFAAGGDLYYKDLSSPSAEAINVTGGYTKGAGDASDPEQSYDAKKVVFSMKGPEDKTWDLWEWYINKADVPAGSECIPAPKDSCLVRVIKSKELADQGDDIDPVYAPDNRSIIFSSTRQQTSVKTSAGNKKYLDEYERREVSVLHRVDPVSALNTATATKDSDDSFIEQISFNQSHDRDPFVTVDGEIIYSRWDHVGGRNHFPVFKASLDGTDLFILYGAFSPGNSRLYPREMPKGGAYEGKVISALMPLQGSNEGGALVLMDVKNYSENNAPAPGVTGGKGQELPGPFNNEQLFDMRNRDEDLASVPKGAVRLSTPYPMYDGTNRVLMAWSPLNVVTVKNEAGEDELREQPRYGIHVFDLDAKVNRPIVSPPDDTNFVYMEPVAIKARTGVNKPVVSNAPKPRDKSISVGHIGVRSVYDTDSLGAMGTGVFTGTEAANYKTKDGVADVAALKRLPLDQRIAFFARITTAVPTPAGVGMNIGETDFEMQRILGYTMVEPDGSLRFDVPADTAFTIQILDKKGRAFQNHTNWIQARPDETRTCPGCHSPRRGDAINSGAILSDHDPLLGTPYIDSNIVVGTTQTMADTRMNDANGALGKDLEGMGEDELALKTDIVFVDVWTPAGNKVPSTVIDYTGIANVNERPAGGVINYAEHIQPIWDSHCVSCHTGNANLNLVPGRLDLTSGTDPITGRSISYQQLVGERLQFTAAGVLVLETNPETGLLEPATLPPLVTRPSGTVGGTRNSFLGEVLYGEELKSSRELTDAIKTAHNGITLNASELRVATEWMDLGAQFINDPAKYNGATVGTLNEGQFETVINPILMTQCSGCHFPGNPDHPTNFVLNSNIEGNLQITVNFINVNNPAQSMLLTKPLGSDISGNTHDKIWSAVDTATYGKVLEWITAAQP